MGLKQYKNKKTGAVIETVSVCVGDWFLVIDESKNDVSNQLSNEPKLNEVADTVEKSVELKKETVTDEDAFNGITVKQIKQELDAFGIEYGPRDNKQTLYDLMMNHGQ